MAAHPRYVFVGGLHRSGTSLLARLLGAHSDVSGLTGTGVNEDEGQLLQSVVPPGHQLGGPGRFGYHGDAHLTEHAASATPAARERLLAAWRPFWDADRPVHLEKSPPNLLRFRWLQAVFDDCAFVAIRRHPGAVALATRQLRLKGRLQRVGPLIEHWLHCHRLFEADRPHLQRLVEVRYEDLVRDPGETLAQVQEALGLSREAPAVEVTEEATRRYAIQWRSRYAGPLGQVRRLGLNRLEGAVRAFGYELDELG